MYGNGAAGEDSAKAAEAQSIPNAFSNNTTDRKDFKIIDDDVNFWEPYVAEAMVLMPHTPFCDMVV